MSFEFSPIIYALLGGILPAFVWLLFWLEEDRDNPEPNTKLLATFLAGMLAVIVVLPFQKAVDKILPGAGPVAFLLWAVLEEGFKFAAAYYAGLRGADDDEPLDPMIYMITAALGFAALENALFLLNPLLQSDITGSLITGNLRFIGSTLLHTVSSGIIGTALDLTFYKSRDERVALGVLAFFLAIFAHTAFNLFILNESGFGTFLTFATVWAGITALILMFEKVKSMMVQ
ncbi:PrsW family intramembrane metalloprotease [Candidatus Parcubacteria bacterium]|nr:PrsW family intramembrane metalloprotease [Candidatus Parcubacteria bacterium]